MKQQRYPYLSQRYPLLAEQLEMLNSWTTQDVRRAWLDLVEAMKHLDAELTRRALQYREEVLTLTNAETVLKLDKYYQDVYPQTPEAFAKFWQDMYTTTWKTLTR